MLANRRCNTFFSSSFIIKALGSRTTKVFTTNGATHSTLLASERSERASLLSCKLRFAIYIYIFIYLFISYVRQNFDLRMLSFTRIARGNFRKLLVFYL